MTDAQPDNPSRKRRWRWWHIPIALLLVLLLAFAGWHIYLSHLIATELARIHAEGYPVTPTELDAWYQYPKAKNAADVYVKAFKSMAEATGDQSRILPIVGDGNWPPPGDPIPPEMQAAIESYLTANARAFKLLHEAGRIEGCRYPGYYGDPFRPTNHYSNVRGAARMLEMRAVYCACTGDSEIAVTAIGDIRALARSMRDEPIVIAQLVRISIDALAVNTVQSVLTRTEPDDAQLQRLEAAFRRDEDDPGLLRGFAGERVYGLRVYDDPSMIDFPTPSSLPPGWVDPGNIRTVAVALSKATGAWKLDQLAYLDFVRKAIAAAKARDLVASKTINTAVDQIPPAYFVARNLATSLGALIYNRVRCHLSLDLARTALAAQRYRLAHHNWPANLQNLVPDYLESVPLDPFDSDHPLRMTRKANQLTIYSIGPNGKDDGGAKGNPSAGSPTGDIVFTLTQR